MSYFNFDNEIHNSEVSVVSVVIGTYYSAELTEYRSGLVIYYSYVPLESSKQAYLLIKSCQYTDSKVSNRSQILLLNLMELNGEV